jgi:hypothetical protein
VGLFPVPPGKDAHFDLGVWHPSVLPFHLQNGEGYSMLLQEYELELDGPWKRTRKRRRDKAAYKVQLFRDEVCAIADRLLDPESDEEKQGRTWSIVIKGDLCYVLISLWPSVADAFCPAIAESAKRHGLVYFDPQSDAVVLPR